MGAIVGAVIGGTVAFIIARNVTIRAERRLALEAASLEGAKVMAGELRELVKCANAVHPNYDDDRNRTMRFRVGDVETAAVLQAPSLPASLKEAVSGAVAAGNSYVKEREKLSRQLMGGLRSQSDAERLDRGAITVLEDEVGGVIRTINTYRTPPANLWR